MDGDESKWTVKGESGWSQGRQFCSPNCWKCIVKHKTERFNWPGWAVFENIRSLKPSLRPNKSKLEHDQPSPTEKTVRSFKLDPFTFEPILLNNSFWVEWPSSLPKAVTNCSKDRSFSRTVYFELRSILSFEFRSHILSETPVTKIDALKWP